VVALRTAHVPGARERGICSDILEYNCLLLGIVLQLARVNTVVLQYCLLYIVAVFAVILKTPQVFVLSRVQQVVAFWAEAEPTVLLLMSHL
jgi:hypothetical protein